MHEKMSNKFFELGKSYRRDSHKEMMTEQWGRGTLYTVMLVYHECVRVINLSNYFILLYLIHIFLFITFL